MAKLGATERPTFRLMWILLFLISTCYCSHLVIGSFAQYFKFEWIAKTKIIAEKLVTFPAVTLCNNLYAQKKIENILFRCFFKDYGDSTVESNCFASDFELLKIYDENGKGQECYRYNSGLNAKQQRVELKTSNKMGFQHGLHMYMYVPPMDVFNIYIGQKFFHL